MHLLDFVQVISWGAQYSNPPNLPDHTVWLCQINVGVAQELECKLRHKEHKASCDAATNAHVQGNCIMGPDYHAL